jgi:hypothetical protein
MKLNKIYIISYLPDDPEIRNERLKRHKIQLEYWKKHNTEIVVFAQNYNEEDYQPGITYIKNKGEIKLPGSARNVCLEHFYNSDDDFTLLIDDDTVLYEGEKYCDSDNCIQILKNIPIERFEKIDIFSMLNPSQTPFTKFYNDNKDILQENLIFHSKINIRADIFIKNLKKFYNKEMYFEDLKDGNKIIMGEDVKFALDAARQGFNIFECKNFVRKDLAWHKSTYCKSKEERKLAFDNLKELCKSWNVPHKNGRFQWKKLANQLGIPNQILVKKEFK